MPELIPVDPRSCHLATTVCEDTFGFDAAPLLILVFVLAAIGLLVTVVLGYRRRRQLLRDHDDQTTDRADPPTAE